MGAGEAKTLGINAIIIAIISSVFSAAIYAGTKAAVKGMMKETIHEAINIPLKEIKAKVYKIDMSLHDHIAADRVVTLHQENRISRNENRIDKIRAEHR